MATRPERIESKQVEFMAKSDYWLGKYLDVKGNTKEARKERAKCRKEWLKSQRPLTKNTVVFAQALRAYAERAGRNAPVIPSEGREIKPENENQQIEGTQESGTEDEEDKEDAEVSLEEIINDRAKLKAEIEGRLKNNKVGIQKIVQDFYNQGVEPDDLLGRKGGENQARAIELLFADNPKLGKKVERIIFMSPTEIAANKELYNDVYQFIRKAESQINKGYERFSLTKKSMDQFSEEVTGDYLKKKLTNSMDYLKEKPLAGIMGIAAIGGLLYYMSHGEKDSWRSWTWDKIKGVAPWIGGAIGLNIATSMYRDDGRSLWDLAFHNPNAFSYDTVTEQFKTDLEAMTDSNRNAFEAMLHLANADADAVYEVYDDAHRSHRETINPETLKSLGGLTEKQARGISGDNLYIGLEAMMRKLGQKKGVKRKKEEEISEGKIAYKKMTAAHPGLQFASIIYLLEVDQVAKSKGKKEGKGIKGTVIAGVESVKGAVGIGDKDDDTKSGKKKKRKEGGSGGEGSEDDGSDSEDGDELDDSSDESLEDELGIEDEDIEHLREVGNNYIKKQFARLDGYEGGWTDKAIALFKDSKFKTFIKSREVFYRSEVNRIMSGKTDADVEATRKELKKMAINLKDEVSGYTAQLSNQDPSSEIVLHDVEGVVVQNMVKDAVWKSNTLKVFNTLELYEMESSYFMDEPEMDLKFVEKYVKKIGYGINRDGKVSLNDAEAYTTFYIDQVHAILPADSETLSLGKKRQVSVNEWKALLVKMDDIPSFQVWVKDNNHELGQVLKEHDRTRAVYEVHESEKVQNRAELLDYGQKKLDEAFKRTDGLEWSAFADPFDAMVGRRKEYYLDQIRKVKDSSLASRKAVDVILDKARKEAEIYRPYEEREGHNTTTVLREVQGRMIESRLEGHKEWVSSVKKVMDYADGNYEFEDWTYILNEPEVMIQFMDTFYDKIKEGKNGATPAQIESYTRYYLDEMNHILANDTNISITNLDGKVKQVSTKEWLNIATMIPQIKNIDQWLAAPEEDRAELKANDKGRAMQERRSVEGGLERKELLDKAKARIDAAFDPADKLDWGLTRDQFEAVIGRRKQTYIGEVTAVKGFDADAENKINEIVKRAEDEGEMFVKYQAREGHNTSTVLMEVQREMIEVTVKEPRWQESAKQVLNYTNGSYEFEGVTYVLNEPEITVQLMDLYYKAIDNGQRVAGPEAIQEYTNYFMWELSYTLANDKNISPDNLSGGVKQISTTEWAQVQNKLGQIQSFDSWMSSGKKSHPALKENDQKRGVTDRIAEEGSELDKYLRERINQIDYKFSEVKKIDKNFLPDNFDAFVTMRREAYVEKLAKAARGQADSPATRDALNKIVSDAAQEVLDYLKFERSSSPVKLLEVEKVMLSHELNRTDWKAGSEKVLQFANGNYEFEGPTFLIDDPAIFADYMKLYISKVSDSAKVSSQDANDYTRYYLFMVQKTLPDDKNVALGSNRFQVSREEWLAKKNKLDMILSYKDWASLPADQKNKPELVQNDLERGVSDRIEAEKKASNEKFMEWFENEADVSKWFRLDGKWPAEFKKEVSSKLVILSHNPDYKNQTNEEYQKTLQEYARYVIVEKRFYEMMIAGNISPDQMYVSETRLSTQTIKEHILKQFKEGFDNNFMKPGKTPQDYNNELEGDLRKTVAIAEIFDELSFKVGPLYLPAIDPINFTP